MPDPAPEPPALPPEPTAGPGPGTVTLSTSLLGDLQVPGSPEQAATLQALAARAAVYATRARGDGTRRTYRSVWRAYEAWRASLGRPPLASDPETVAMYAVHAADRGLSLSSLRVALAAIQAVHRLAGIAVDLRHPRLVMLLEGIARTKGSRPAKQATAAGPDALRRMLATRPGPETPLGARDRALLLVGFAAALRRSELVGLALGDVEVVPGRGLRLLVRRSKTDQRGAGQAIAVWANPAEPGLCPARALDAWLGFRQGAGDRTSGASDAALPVFVGLSKAGKLSSTGLSDKAVWRLVKTAAAEAGLDGQPRTLFRPLAAGRPCHRRRRGRGRSCRRHAPDPPPLRRGCPHLPAARRALAQQCLPNRLGRCPNQDRRRGMTSKDGQQVLISA